MLIPAQLVTIVRRLRTSSYRMRARMNHGKNDHDRTTRLARGVGGVPVLGSSLWDGPNQEPLFEMPEVPRLNSPSWKKAVVLSAEVIPFPSNQKPK